MIHTDDKVIVTSSVPDGYARFVSEVGIVLDVSDDGIALVEVYDPDSDNIEEVPFEIEHLTLASDDDARLAMFRLLANAAADAAGVGECDAETLEKMLDAMLNVYNKSDYILTVKKGG